MHIIKITAAAGAGKTTALQDLAKLYQTQVISSTALMAAMPLLMTRTSALALNTFVDEVEPTQLPQIKKLVALYPAEYRIYIAGEKI